MRPFSLWLQSIDREWRSDEVLSFVAHDNSGSFGIQAQHERLITCLTPGLAQFRCIDGDWQYIAQPGSVVVFSDNQLRLATPQFILSRERGQLISQMEAEWREAEHALRTTKRNYVQVEQALTRKIWEMSRRGEGYELA